MISIAGCACQDERDGESAVSLIGLHGYRAPWRRSLAWRTEAEAVRYKGL